MRAYGRNGREWPVDTLRAVLKFGLYNKRFPAFDGVFIHASNDSPHGVVRQRALNLYRGAVLLFDFLLAVKDGVHRQRPVDHFRSRAPRQAFSCFYLLAARRRVCSLRPDNRPPVAACYQNEALACRGRAIIGGDKLPMVHVIAEIPQLLQPLPKSLPRFLLDGFSLPDRAPGCKLFHVFEDNNPWAHRPGPAQHDPREPPDIPVHKGAALGFREVLAIRRKPCQPYRASSAYLCRVNIPHGCLQVHGVRVVRLVHQDRRRVMVDGDCNRPPRRKFYPCARAASAGKIVNYDFVQKAYLRSGLSFHWCWPPVSSLCTTSGAGF